MRGKNLSVETMRGLACLLLVACHVIGANSHLGLRLPDDVTLRPINDVLGYLRMPMFTFLSGVVYAMRPIVRDEVWRFTRAKLKRLLGPLVVVAGLFALVQMVTPGAHMHLEPIELWRIYVWPYAHFWFLQALLLVFAVVAAFELMGWLSTLRRWSAVVATACILFFVHIEAPSVFSANRALYLLPFFLAGIGFYRFEGLRAALGGYAGLVGVVAMLALASFAATGNLALAQPADLALRLGLGVIASVWLLQNIIAIPPLVWIGQFSFSIYLHHVWGTAAARIVLERLGVDSTAIHLICGLVAGVVVSIIIELAWRDVPVMSRLLLGQRPRKRKSAQPAAGGRPPSAMSSC